MKFFFISLLFLFSSLVQAQRTFQERFSEPMPKLDVLIEYFIKADSFFTKQGIAEIVVEEEYVLRGETKYAKPVLINRFDKSGRRIHSEINHWNENGGGASRYSDDYGDSLVYVTDEKYIHSGKLSHYRNISTRYRIDDTLSRTIVRDYYGDSLMRTKDQGIFDSRAEGREIHRARARSKTNAKAGKAPVGVDKEVEEPRARSCDIEGFEPRAPEPVVEYDSRGRAIKIHRDMLIYDGDKVMGIPSLGTLISYRDSSDVISSVKVYQLCDPAKAHKLLEKSTSGITYTGPLCYEPSCLIYAFKAGNFNYGMPMLVTITPGSRKDFVKTYRTKIILR